jgi:gamma-glutamyltranspeptidase/glutathione hydrolase
MHHQWFPDELVIEQNDVIPSSTLEALRGMGHRVVVRQSVQGSAHSVWIDPRTGERVGVADGRRGGAAAGTEREGQ